MYDETMSTDCQRGQCDDCPEQGLIADGSEWPIYCACVCHIPDTTDEYADALAEAWYENYYGTART